MRYHGGRGAQPWFLPVVVVLPGDVAGFQLKQLFTWHRPCAEYCRALQLVARAGMPSSHALNYFAAVFAMTTRHRSLIVILAIVAIQVCISRLCLVTHNPARCPAGRSPGLYSAAGWRVAIRGLWPSSGRSRGIIDACRRSSVNVPCRSALVMGQVWRYPGQYAAATGYGAGDRPRPRSEQHGMR